jgi:hypothetical protein
MTPGLEIGLDRINADFFPAGVAGALSLFTDFVIGHAAFLFAVIATW